MDNQEQLELIRSMSEKLERIEKRQRAARGWRLVIWLGVIALLAAVVIYFGPKVMAEVQRYNAAVEKIEAVSAELGDIDLSGVKETFKYLETVDFSALKEKTAEASKLLDKLSEIDFAKTFKTLDKMEESLAPVIDFFS